MVTSLSSASARSLFLHDCAEGMLTAVSLKLIWLCRWHLELKKYVETVACGGRG